MKRNLSIILVSIVFFASFASALNLTQSNLKQNDFSINQISSNISVDQIFNLFENITCQKIKPFTSEIIGIEIPDKLPYKNEIFDLYLKKKFMGKITIQNGKITSFSCSNVQKRTYDIYIKNFTTILSFSKGFDIDLFKEKLNSGEIVIKGKGFNKKIKFFFSKIILKWFI